MGNSESNEKLLGTELEALCMHKTNRLPVLGKSIFTVFKIDSSASPQLKKLALAPEVVAVKQVLSSPEFVWEAREWNAQLKMRHENVVRLFAVGSTDDYK